MVSTYPRSLLTVLLMGSLSTIIWVLFPIISKWIITYTESPELPLLPGLALLLCLLALKFLHNLTQSHLYFNFSLLGYNISNCLSLCIYLTIAHRINTILSSDRILVLNSGQAVQFDTPDRLIQNQGYFYQLYSQSKSQI